MVPDTARLQRQVLEHIAKAGRYGCSDDDLKWALGLRHQTASARRRELVLMGLVVDSSRRRTTRSGRKATVWVLRQYGKTGAA
jgi:hypothetical protein